jgi:hypothetical protein
MGLLSVSHFPIKHYYKILIMNLNTSPTERKQFYSLLEIGCKNTAFFSIG